MAYANTKVAAVLADIMLGMPKSKAAEKHGVAERTVYNWAEQLQELRPQKEISELVKEHMLHELESLRAIAEHAQNESWLRAQPAGDVAVLYGVISDKLHIKLAAWQQADKLHRENAAHIPSSTPPPEDRRQA